MNENKKQFCTFYVDNLYLGIEVEQVQEVIRHQKMTFVPLAPPAIAGLINLRGQIVTALDLRCQLGLPPRHAETLPMNVVVQDGENAVSLLVDRIGDVVEVSESSFELPPSTVSADVRQLVMGAYKLPNRLLLGLNVKRAVEAAEEPNLTLTA
jgi:purine-binding chemotaxis protein CheW